MMNNKIGVARIPIDFGIALPEPNLLAIQLDHHHDKWYSLAETLKMQQEMLNMLKAAGFTEVSNEKDSCNR